MRLVTVRGSINPCVDLATGDEMTFEYNEWVDRRIQLGYFDVVEWYGDEDTPLPPEEPQREQSIEDDITPWPVPVAEPAPKRRRAAKTGD